MLGLVLLAASLTLCAPCVTASAADAPDALQAPDSGTTDTGNTELQAQEADPLEPFNSAMFTFNLKVDDYVLHPVASGYAKVIPEGGREAIGRALDNVRVIPRF